MQFVLLFFSDSSGLFSLDLIGFNCSEKIILLTMVEVGILPAVATMALHGVPTGNIKA